MALSLALEIAAMQWLRRPALDMALKNGFKLQYISDLHLDHEFHKPSPKPQQLHPIPSVTPIAEHLAICGDLGNPHHPHFEGFLRQVSKQFKTVLFVPGNHDFDCGPQLIPSRKEHYGNIMMSICRQFKNVHYLDQKTHRLSNECVVAGLTLWPNPDMPLGNSSNLDMPPGSQLAERSVDLSANSREHERSITWLNRQLHLHKFLGDQVIVLSHFMPSLRLISERGRKRPLASQKWHATDLESFIKDPVGAWICGHTHHVEEHTINGIPCVTNPYGYSTSAAAATKYLEIISPPSSIM